MTGPEGSALAAQATVTRLLHAVNGGESHAHDELFLTVYEELRRMAHLRMRRESPGNTLQTTALVNEAYLRLVAGQEQTWQNKAHFFGAAAEAMRRILIERFRRRSALKRGGENQRVPLTEGLKIENEDQIDLLALDEALQKLESLEPRRSEIVKLRYFVGLTVEEIAEMFDVTDRTVFTEWRFAKAWLRREMSKGDDPSSQPGAEGDEVSGEAPADDAGK